MNFQTCKFDEPVAVLGDIHGQVDKLIALLDQLGSRPVLVTGDVGDRGPDTKGVLDLLVQRRALGVLGNHDEWLRDFAAGGKFDSYALNPVMGGRQTLASYGIAGRGSSAIELQYLKIPKSHKDWLLALPIVFDLEVMGKKYWLAHAGVSPMATQYDKPLPEIMRFLSGLSTSNILWDSFPPQRMQEVDRPVIMGHIVQREPYDSGHIIAIDTGCGFPGGKLTALLLPERKFLQV